MCVFCSIAATDKTASWAALPGGSSASWFSADAPAPAEGAISLSRTGLQGLDAVLSGTRWSGTSLSYSFPDASSDFGSYNSSANEPGSASLTQVSLAQQNAIRSILEGTGPGFRYGSVEAITGLNISEAPSGTGLGDLRFTQYTGPSTAYAYYPSNSEVGGDVWFGTAYNYRNPLAGNYQSLTHIHEIGHALGLKHGHETGGFGALPSGLDSMEFSVMTYRSYVGQTIGGYTNETYGYAQTFMMYDIAALQTMYGANYATQAGNSVYRWDSLTGEMSIDGIGQGAAANGAGGSGNRVFLTTWDGNGIDTYDLSNYATNLQLDLRPGMWSNFGTQLATLGPGQVARGNVFNALLHQGDARSYIENAVGGSGDDRITGNQTNNRLSGGAGKDVIYGNIGEDALEGNAGQDSMYGGQGDDWTFGGRDDDLIYGNFGSDAIYGNLGDDTLFGGGGADLLFGGAGADVLVGGAGDDQLIGGLGADRYVIGRGNAVDLILGFDVGQGDRLDLQGQTFTTDDDGHGGTRLTLSGGGTINLAGISASQINGAFFA